MADEIRKRADTSSHSSANSTSIIKGQLELKDLSDAVAKGMLEIDGSTTEIATAAKEIVSHSSELDSVVEVLKKEIDNFTL